MERQSKGPRGLEAYCKGGQGPPRAVAPSKKKKKNAGYQLLQVKVATCLYAKNAVYMNLDNIIPFAS